MVCGRGRCTESASCRGGPSCGLHGIGSAGSKAPGDLGTGRTAGAYTTLGTTSASIAGSTPAWCVGGEARRERAVPRRPKLWTTGAEALGHLAAGRYARKAAPQGSPALMAPPRLARSGGARRLRTLCTICSRWRSRGASGGGCRSTRFRGADSVSVRLRGSARTIYHTLGPGATQGTHRPAAGVRGARRGRRCVDPCVLDPWVPPPPLRLGSDPALAHTDGPFSIARHDDTIWRARSFFRHPRPVFPSKPALAMLREG